MDGPFDLAAVLADAQRKESLTDWGPGEFERPLGVLLADYAVADLNVVGAHILRSGIVHSLRMRLRAQEWIRRHPEILDERIVAPIVVVGMMRSGTTLLQRLLAADPPTRSIFIVARACQLSSMPSKRPRIPSELRVWRPATTVKSQSLTRVSTESAEAPHSSL